MRSRTSRNPPPWGLTCLGLRVRNSAILSSFVFSFDGLLGTEPGTFPFPPFRGLADKPAAADELEPEAAASLSGSAGAGISSHSSPETLSSRRKNGHIFVSIPSDSCASARESGTGDDLMTMAATSDAGIARRLRAVGAAVAPPTGFEKYLWHAQTLVFNSRTTHALCARRKEDSNRKNGGTNIQTLSAIPDNLPRSNRRRSSAWPSLNSSSLDKGAPVGLAFVGVF